MTETVTSAHNPLVKLAASLRQKKHRDESGLFAVEGVRLAEELAAAGWPLQVCIHTAEAAASPRAAKLMAALGCRVVAVPEAVYAKITDTQEPQGLMLIAAKRPATLAAALAGPGPALIAVLDGVQDPGNAGTVIRAADAAGCTGAVLLEGCADPFAGKTVRATMGSLFHLPVAAGVGRDELAGALAAAGIPLVAASLDGTPCFAADLGGPAAIVFGAEGQGVSPALLARAASRVTIPIWGRAESLNVAAAAAVILYEAARQRRASL